MNIRWFRYGWLLMALMACAGAWAQQCRLEASGLDFGEYIPTSNSAPVLDGTGSFTVICDNPASTAQYLTVCIGLGAGSGGGGAIRNLPLAGGGSNSTLRYRLYRTPRQVPWGTGPTALRITTLLPANAGMNVIATPTLYGRIVGSQQPVAGQYASTFSGMNDIRFWFDYSSSGYATSCPGAGTSPDIEPFTITASVPQYCEIISGPGTLDFGTAAGIQVPERTANFKVDVRCTGSTEYSIALDDGQFSDAPGQRRMQSSSNAAHRIGYEIYQDSARTTRWGSTPGGAQGVINAGLTGTGAPQSYQGYGHVPGGTSAPGVGTYEDRVVVTVEW